MKKVKKFKTNLAGVVFVACLIGMFLLTSTYEQDGITTKEYITYSAITLAVFLWSGVKGQLLHK